MTLTFDRKRFMRMVATALLLLSALVLGSCASEEGMYQGGGDSSPGWRK